MKPNKAFAVLLAMAVMASAAYANVLDINPDQSKLQPGTSIYALNSTFNITGIENFYVSRGDSYSVYRIVFLENLDKLNIARKQVNTMGELIATQQALASEIMDMINYKQNDNLVLEARLDSLKKESCTLSNQSDALSLQAEKLSQDVNELDTSITGNFLMTQGQTSALLVVFTILIAAVIAIEFKAYFRPGKAAAKTDAQADQKAEKKQ